MTPLIAKIPVDHNQTLDLLEKLIDQHGLSYVVNTVAEVCSTKADNILETWQDESIAESWDHAASILMTDCEVTLKHIS